METFSLKHHWRGSTAEENYSKRLIGCAEGKPDIVTSSGGGPGAELDQWNPEDLLGLALTTCHTLTFLALARKVGLDVRAVDTDVDVILEKGQHTMEVTKIRLTAKVTVPPGTDTDKVVKFYDKAHKYCYVAASIKSEVEHNVQVVAGT